VAGIDREAFEAVAAAWTAGQLPGPGPETARLAVAIDGKTVRGARTGDQAAPHLLAACTHATRGLAPVVLAQRQIPGKTNEIPMVAALLQDLRAAGHDPATMVFTADALCRRRHKASYEDVRVMPMCCPGPWLVARFRSLRLA